LFLVGFLTEEEYKAFQEIRTDESVLKSATEIAGYAFTREDRTLVEVYADSNWSAQREVISRELASTTFQKAVFSPS
jgi:ferric iron reductase protein FhuF